MDPGTGFGAPKPLNVTPVLDGARAVTKTIGSAGGTVTTTDSRGTTVTLTIPADALPGNTDVVMTPLSSIEGLPYSGELVGAVDLKPSGLRFYKPATLSIQPTTMPAIGVQAPFLYRDSGKDFHAYPLTLDKTKLEMALLHFSGAGVKTASSPDEVAEYVKLRVPSDLEAQAEQRGAEIVDRYRRGVIDGAQFGEELVLYFQEFYKRIVLPRLKAAVEDDALVRLAIATAVSWRQKVELYSLGEDFAAQFAETWGLLEKILGKAYERSFTRCVTGEVAHIGRLVGLARSAALLGLDVGADFSERTDRCLRFTLDYELVLRYRKSSGNMERFDLVVESTDAPLRYSFSNNEVEGGVPLTVPVWTHYDNICSNGPEGGTATVRRHGFADLSIDSNLKYEVHPDGRVTSHALPPSIRLSLDAGDVALTCYQSDFDRGIYDRFKRFLYPDLLHPLDRGRFLLVSNWTYAQTDPWAQIVDIREKTGPDLNAVTNGSLVVRLHHEPERQ